MKPKKRIATALDIAIHSAGVDGAHHKMWAIDQMIRALTGCPTAQKTAKDYKGDDYTFETMGESQEYLDWIKSYQDGEDGPLTYEWDIGIAP